MNVFSNSGGYKINIEKSIIFKYTSNKQLEIEIKQSFPFIIVFKKLEIGQNLTKYVYDLNTTKHY